MGIDLLLQAPPREFDDPLLKKLQGAIAEFKRMPRGHNGYSLARPEDYRRQI